mmetsp:Transcript_3843/g.8607  ORF Transcript_3843/g.8607 Transcript_3843/m.8607 type:complete len:215 (+) Transcript_3843:1596-2240(+)
MPTIVTRVPGEMRCTSARSTATVSDRGVSPLGTDSGASCSLSVCWSMYWLFSGCTTQGSSEHGFAPGSTLLARWHVRGSCTPPNPGLHGQNMTPRQSLHLTHMAVAFAFALLAPMTIPETRTSLVTFSDVRFRMVDGPNWLSLYRSTCTGVRSGSSPLSSLCLEAASTSAAASSSCSRYSDGLSMRHSARSLSNCCMCSILTRSRVRAASSASR